MVRLKKQHKLEVEGKSERKQRKDRLDETKQKINELRLS